VRQNKDGEQKLFKRSGHFSLLWLCFATALYGQSFSDFQKLPEKSTSQEKKAFSAFQSTHQSAYKSYQSEQDAAFVKYLKKQWDEYKAFEPKTLFSSPKPQTSPQTQTDSFVKLGPKIYIEVKEEEKTEFVPQEEKEKKEKSFSLMFYGQKLSFFLPSTLDEAKYEPMDQEGIFHFFNAIASVDLEALLVEIKTVHKDLKLNDWGLHLLVSKIAQHLYHDPNEAKLCQWYLFNKLGYDLRVGIVYKEPVLLYPTMQKIYAKSYIQLENKEYYIFSDIDKKSLNALYTYEHNYPNAKKSFDLALEELPSLAKTIQTKTIEFKYFAQTYKVEYQYNQNLIDLLATYPQVEYAVFFNAPFDPLTYDSLVKDLQKIVDAKHASEVLNILLRFVQTGFEYQRDSQHFGAQKVMFAQETLAYSSSDCDDRAVLFASLVRKLLGLSVAGVLYEEHMATALEIPLQGDKVILGSKEYIIADPTYINANVGMSMPKYKNRKPKGFIELR